jgi:hypothetical protein
MVPQGPRLPPNYVNVNDAIVRRGVLSVMGVVVDIMGGAAYRTNGTSMCITFTIKDQNLDNGHVWDGLRIKYFKESETLLPPVQEGDVILLRDLRIKIWNGKVLGVAPQDRIIPWAVFRPDRDPTAHLPALTGPSSFEPTYQEKTYAASLLEASPGTFRTVTVTRSNLAQVSVSRPASTTQKFSLLQDIQDGQFVDLIGEIIKIYGNDSEKATLYFTDYTKNDNLFLYASDDNDSGHGREGDPYGYIQRQKKNWNGPTGRMSIQITLWEPHASFVRGNFNIGDIVRLKNVKIKWSRVEEGSLEAVVHGNRANPDETNAFSVNSSNDPRVQQLLARREAYWNARPKKQKREPNEDNERPSRKPNKRQSKVAPKKELGQTILDIKKRMAVNEHVEPRVPPSGVHAQSLEAILNNPSHDNISTSGIRYRLPFQNLCYLTTVRVVDFYPPLLEDFAVHKEQVSLAYNRKHDPASRTFKIWEWRFCLLVEGSFPATLGQSNERAKLFVSNYEAEHLLQLNAVDLRRRSEVLGQLREKLFILWGDLEERKRRAIETGNKSLDIGPVSSKPFNCCIMEYGVRCSHPRDPNKGHDGRSYGCADRDCFGWERRFGLLKTTIHG